MRTGEMALRNPAFCYGRTDAGPKSKEHYQKALAAFPDSAVAGTALRMVDLASSRGLPANPVSFPGSCAMSLFDSIECEYPIPDGQHQKLQFQTKDLECLLDHYTITRDGCLLRHARREGPGTERDIEWPYHGDIRIYDSDPDKAHQLIEYVVRFTHGRVEWIRRAGEAAQEPNDGIQVRSPAAGMQDRLMPDQWGRRLTVDEYVFNSPEKLELIDGAIPGTSQLLLLLLTSVGLRRAVKLVGADRWRKALADDEPGDL